MKSGHENKTVIEILFSLSHVPILYTIQCMSQKRPFYLGYVEDDAT